MIPDFQNPPAKAKEETGFQLQTLQSLVFQELLCVWPQCSSEDTPAPVLYKEGFEPTSCHLSFLLIDLFSKNGRT